jgi:hypothetical protein
MSDSLRLGSEQLLEDTAAADGCRESKGVACLLAATNLYGIALNTALGFFHALGDALQQNHHAA